MGEERRSTRALPVLHRPSRRAGRCRARGTAPRIRQLRALRAGETTSDPRSQRRAKPSSCSRVPPTPATDGLLSAAPASCAMRHRAAPAGGPALGARRSGRPPCWRAGGWAMARSSPSPPISAPSRPAIAAHRRQAALRHAPTKAIAGGMLAPRTALLCFLEPRAVNDETILRAGPRSRHRDRLDRHQRPAADAVRAVAVTEAWHPATRWADPRASQRSLPPSGRPRPSARPHRRSAAERRRPNSSSRTASRLALTLQAVVPADRHARLPPLRYADREVTSPWRRRAASRSATSHRGQAVGLARQIYSLRAPATAASATRRPWPARAGRGAAGRRRHRAQPGACLFPADPEPLRPLFAVQPAVPQSAADRPGTDAGRAPRGRRDRAR